MQASASKGSRGGALNCTSPNLTREIGMTRNEGTVDRILRAVAGAALLSLMAAGIIGAWGWIGIVPLLTAAAGWCPLYRMLGIGTCTPRS